MSMKTSILADDIKALKIFTLGQPS